MMNKLFYNCLFIGIFILSCTQNEITERKFCFDDDGMLVIDGKRTFIIGSYYAPKSDTPFAEMRQDGYNYIRVAGNREQLDAAIQHGLYCWISIGSINPQNRDESANRLREMISTLKDHPGLLCWETEDEPAFTWNSAAPRIKPEQLIETYQLIKQEDPEHLVYLNHAPVNLVATLQAYNPAADIIACDIYPVAPRGIRISYALFPDGLQGDLLNSYISQVGEYTDKMRRVGGASKPLFMVLQGFSWEMLRDANDRDPNMIQYPSYAEIRFMAYNAIIHGANGIVYWGTHYTPTDAPFWKDLKKVTRELGDMQEILVARKLDLTIGKRYRELGHSVDAGIEILAKLVNDKTYLLTANADRYPAQVTFSGLNGFSNVVVLREDRELLINNGEFTDHYQSFDVHIYELTK